MAALSSFRIGSCFLSARVRRCANPLAHCFCGIRNGSSDFRIGPRIGLPATLFRDISAVGKSRYSASMEQGRVVEECIMDLAIG
jgi:hypothetical protein